MFGIFKRRGSRRINELLAANNAYLARARAAESANKVLGHANQELHNALFERDRQDDMLTTRFAALVAECLLKDDEIAELASTVIELKTNNEHLSREAVHFMHQHGKGAVRLRETRKRLQQANNRLWLQEEVNRNLSKELGARPPVPSAAVAAASGKPGPWNVGDGFEMREAA